MDEPYVLIEALLGLNAPIGNAPMKLTILATLLFLVSCGPSGGKRVATEEALRLIENVYEQRTRGEAVLSMNINSARAAMAAAAEAGDPAKRADVEISLHLKRCGMALDLYQSSVEQPDLFPATELKEHEQRISSCIATLKKDLGKT